MCSKESHCLVVMLYYSRQRYEYNGSSLLIIQVWIAFDVRTVIQSVIELLLSATSHSLVAGVCKETGAEQYEPNCQIGTRSK